MIVKTESSKSRIAVPYAGLMSFSACPIYNKKTAPASSVQNSIDHAVTYTGQEFHFDLLSLKMYFFWTTILNDQHRT